ncbi:hypothetical protein EVJ50_00725 [Synechococcus sp. RSCCF101]|uniref:hypothetical protein n=1 Tax=Synechococcus sp. RSCCF101 TaxID=2511069 RepID=UPI001246541E|nr:hypothetical protein [Synechococcus sp. RSCCF101]QEY30994.1 hypothetical protein EVJ50_00725 [Synechococcus sp. RSCCF101]
MRQQLQQDESTEREDSDVMSSQLQRLSRRLNELERDGSGGGGASSRESSTTCVVVPNTDDELCCSSVDPSSDSVVSFAVSDDGVTDDMTADCRNGWLNAACLVAFGDA